MRVPRARFLHILAIAPVAAIAAGVLGPAPHALAASSQPPAPIVVTVDPAFGGQPTPSRPGVRFDPGAIGVNGLLEKDVDLDVGKRLAALLRADLVNVVMTRSTDAYVSASRRAQLSKAHHAVLVISVGAATAANPNTRGTLVLYPGSAGKAFAQTVSDALAAQVTTDGLPDGGTALGDVSWFTSTSPGSDGRDGVSQQQNGRDTHGDNVISPGGRRRNARRCRGIHARDHRQAQRDPRMAKRSPRCGVAEWLRAGVGNAPGDQWIPVRAGDRVAAGNRCGWTCPAVPRSRCARPRGADRDDRASVQRCAVAAPCRNTQTSTAAARRWVGAIATGLNRSTPRIRLRRHPVVSRRDGVPAMARGHDRYVT